MERYPCLKLATDALIQGGSALGFNASNEIAVDAFLANRIGFDQISSIIEHTLTLFEHRTFQSLDDLLTSITKPVPWQSKALFRLRNRYFSFNNDYALRHRFPLCRTFCSWLYDFHP